MFTRGNPVWLAGSIYKDLSGASDHNTAKFCAYKSLEAQLDCVEQTVNDVYRHAMEQDPSGQSNMCQVAMHLEKKVAHVGEMIRELVQIRQNGADCLRRWLPLTASCMT